MDSSKKIVKIMCIVVFIICLICSILLYILSRGDSNTSSNNDDENVIEGDPLVIEYSTKKLRDPTKFFSVQEYIKNNLDDSFVAEDMNILNEDRLASFAVKGYVTDAESNDTKEVYLIFRVDTENDTCSMQELDNIYDNVNQVDLSTNIKEIVDDGENGFEYTTISSENMCRIYLQHFTNLELNDPEKAYNLIDDQYKKERFPTFDKYQEYLKECSDSIRESVLAKYSVNYNEDYTEYILVDNYDNSYTVRETSVMNYTIKLDNYTIKVDNYEEEYSKLSEENKVQSNVYIFLQMINTKDYEHAYELLDTTFKNNNFDTLDKFKEYVRQNFFSHNFNSVSEMDIDVEGDYYIYTTTLRNNSGSAAYTKGLTVIMKLLQGTDFVMSFSLE